MMAIGALAEALLYNPTMEQTPLRWGEERKDYTQDPQYRRNLRAWNAAQVEVMTTEETRQKVAVWSNKDVASVTEDDLADYWAAEGSEEWREENKYNPNFFEYVEEMSEAA